MNFQTIIIIMLMTLTCGAENMGDSLTAKPAFAPKSYDRKLKKTLPTDIDTLLRNKEVEFSDFTLSKQKNNLLGGVLGNNKQAAELAEATKKGKNYFVLQFEAVADFDAAQKRKAVLQQRTGYGVWFVFDSPFYKLRGGGWTSKEEAEDRAVALREAGISAFVLKIR